MGIVKRTGDLVYTIRFLKLLVTKFEETDAYKYGIIDSEGKRLKSFDMSTSENRSKYKDAYTPFQRLVFNIKRLIAKAPGGSSRIASLAAALYLLKEKYDFTDDVILEGLKRAGVDTTDILTEGSKWFLLSNNQLSPGMYVIRNSKCLNSTLDEMANKNDKIRVDNDAFPVGEIFGINLYEATHIRTQQKVYITIEDIIR